MIAQQSNVPVEETEETCNKRLKAERNKGLTTRWE